MNIKNPPKVLLKGYKLNENVFGNFLFILCTFILFSHEHNNKT